MIDFDALLLNPAIQAFGEGALFLSDGGSPIEVTGVFDAAYQLVEAQAAIGVSSTAPSLGIRLRDFPSTPEQGDRVRVRGLDYTVIDIRPDGYGGAQLILQKS